MADRKKILQIIARLNVGGSARHVTYLSRDLQNTEYQTTLVAGTVPDGEDDMSYIAQEAGLEPIYIKEMSRELSAKDVISLAKLYALMRRLKPDIVHTHTAKAGTVGRIAAFFYRWITPGSLIGRPRRLKIVHTFHGHIFHSYYGRAKTRLFISIEKILARFATDKIVVITDQQFQEIHKEVGIGQPDQFEIVRLGIDLANFSRSGDREIVRAEFGLSESSIAVGFVGRLTAIKNLPMLIDAVSRIESDRPQSESDAIKFVIAGDGDSRDELDLKVRSLGLRNVKFLGNVRDTERIYAAFDIVVLTSLNEGTPLSLIEAMAAERPVISTVVGGVPDLLGDVLDSRDGFTVHERGIGVPSGSIEGLATGLIYLAENEKLRSTIAKRGLDYVNMNYSRRRLAEDIKALYRAI